MNVRLRMYEYCYSNLGAMYAKDSEILGVSRTSQSRDANFTYMESPRGFARIFRFREDIHPSRMVILSAE